MFPHYAGCQFQAVYHLSYAKHSINVESFIMIYTKKIWHELHTKEIQKWKARWFWTFQVVVGKINQLQLGQVTNFLRDKSFNLLCGKLNIFKFSRSPICLGISLVLYATSPTVSGIVSNGTLNTEKQSNILICRNRISISQNSFIVTRTIFKMKTKLGHTLEVAHAKIQCIEHSQISNFCKYGSLETIFRQW